MMIFGVLFFGIAIFIVSFVLSRVRNLDKGFVSVFITLIGWSSLLFGIFISRFAPPLFMAGAP